MSGLFNETNPRLTFEQAYDRVLFAVILMARRLEDPDDNLQNALFSYDGTSFTFTPIGDEYLESAESISALSQDLVTLGERNNAVFAFLLVSHFLSDEITEAVLHALSPTTAFVKTSVLHRRKFGNPILKRWSSPQPGHLLTDPIVQSLAESLKGKTYLSSSI